VNWTCAIPRAASFETHTACGKSNNESHRDDDVEDLHDESFFRIGFLQISDKKPQKSAKRMC
jgi:hypothetical protein